VHAVVHHGGVGTTAAGIRASRPTQIVSFFGDQPYWGRCVELMGMGPRPLHRTKLTTKRLEEALTDLVSTPTYAERAERAGEVVRGEDGVRRAVDVISAELG
jgi:sterol 3beta-glucosyltransferase